MGSSVGRIALGLVGAVIGAPFGLSAIGFSIGSSLGGMIFAPDGPHTEGPRLGDTSVNASSLGKIIAEHWGVTRTSGNVIWSGGIKEVKKTEKVKSGGKGGKKPTVTTYTYFCSFALCLGKGPASSVRKIWADGKLIYDGSGESETDNSRYNWRLRRGTEDEPVDYLIAESINRRLAGLPDINAGNGPQATYTTMNDLITQLSANPDPRSQLYADLLFHYKGVADAALAGGGYNDWGGWEDTFFGKMFQWLMQAFEVFIGSSNGTTGVTPDYRFTPAYRGLAMIIFDDMALEDFGNRIPNVTAEVVWEGAYPGNGQSAEEAVRPVATPVAQIAATATPTGLMATDTTTKKTFTHAGNTIRRFSAEGRREDRQNTLRAISLPAGQWSRRIWVVTGGEESGYWDTIPQFNEYGYTVDRMLMALPVSGNPVAIGNRNTTPAYNNLPPSNVQTMFVLDSNGLEAVASFTDAALRDAEFGAGVRITGAYPRAVQTKERDRGDYGFVSTDEQTGDHGVVVTGGTLTGFRIATDTLTDVTSIGIDTSGFATSFNGPVASGFGFGGNADVFVSRYNANGVWIGQYNVVNSAITSSVAIGSAISMSKVRERGIGNPFSTGISYVSGVIHHPGTEGLLVVVGLTGGGTGIAYLDEALGTLYNLEIPGVNPPHPNSGLSRSDVTNNTLAFAEGTTIVEIRVVDGGYTVHEGVLGTAASWETQAYFAEVAGLLLWEGGVPKIYTVGTIGGNSRDHDIADVLPNVIRSICLRAGMTPDEFDVSGVTDFPVRGYTIARPTSGRQALENLMEAFFVEGIESDWKIKFADRGTTPIRTINEDELGEISSPTGPVNWLESRVPEYEVPFELNVNYADPVRDYQTNTAHKRRISNPIPSMYSNKVMNIEMPLVMKEFEANSMAERLLYLSWMSRTSGKTLLNWKHADLDPGDVVAIRFNDGRTITDRIMSATLGANFEIETQTVSSGDPVFEPAPDIIIPTGSIPTVNSPRPVSSEMFVFDIPLLFDYHQTGRASARYYTAVGSEDEQWNSATIFRSLDGNSFAAAETVDLEATWGSVLGVLPEPRALWSTDNDTILRVAIAKDRGDISSVTREDILNGANRALVYNRESGVGEIIQFQNAVLTNDSGVYEFTGLTRGLRGTDYAASLHTAGEIFILLDETDIQVNPLELELLGQTVYFKAVSAGQLITGVPSRSRSFRGRSLMPYAPSRVRRSDDGTDLTVSWNRRTRLGGSWDMTTPMELVPLNEDFEQYELYLIAPGEQALLSFDPVSVSSYLEKVTTNTTSHVFTASQLAAHGLTLSDAVNVAVFQISAQVGRGFPSVGELAP